MKKLSIIIPAHNEEVSVVSVIGEVKKTVKELNFPFEIIVVNDGSTDNTKNLLENEEGIILINHLYKKGYGASLKHGVKKAEGDFVLFIDADGQQNPKDIPRLLEYIDKYDMVIGERTNTVSLARAIAKKILLCFANYLAEYKIPDLNSGFRVLKKDIVTKYSHLLPDSFSLTSTLTIASIKEGYNLKYIPIQVRKRVAGKSTIDPIKDFVRFFMLILRLTILFSPFRVFLPISFGLFLIGSVYIIFNLVRFFDVPDSGIFLVLSSIIIFFFGLLADQIAYIRRKIK